jgi:spore coat protein A
VVHVHGARVAGSSDGWTENCLQAGETATGRYPNQPRATMPWYHDHATGVTRLNVHAGLAGRWFIRDTVEDDLGLPRAPTRCR